MKRDDDFAQRRAHLAAMSDDELYEHFWSLADTIVAPLLDLGKTHTTPSIERSILLRMGLSSLEAGPIVDGLIDRDLLGKGAGHVVWRTAKALNLTIPQVAKRFLDGTAWDTVAALFPEDEDV